MEDDFISAVKNGVPWPNAKIVKALATAAGVSPSDLRSAKDRFGKLISYATKTGRLNAVLSRGARCYEMNAFAVWAGENDKLRALMIGVPRIARSSGVARGRSRVVGVSTQTYLPDTLRDCHREIRRLNDVVEELRKLCRRLEDQNQEFQRRAAISQTRSNFGRKGGRPKNM